MRDYSNMPTLDWSGSTSAKRAIAQVHQEEPVILQMPQGFNMDIDADTCGCKAGKGTIQHINCHAENTLTSLAQTNDEPELIELAKVAHEAGQVVDIDTTNRLVIIHD